ncbi:MAG: hypothetical protein AAF443_00240 [Chlamydiota bacterium]
MLKSTVIPLRGSPVVWGALFLLTCLLLPELGFCVEGTDIYAEVEAAGTNLKKLVFGTGGKTIMLVFGIVVGACVGLGTKKIMAGVAFLAGVVLFILIGETVCDLVANSKLKF